MRPAALANLVRGIDVDTIASAQSTDEVSAERDLSGVVVTRTLDFA